VESVHLFGTNIRSGTWTNMVYELLVQAFRFFIICSIFLLISHSLDDMPHLMQQVTAMRPLRSVTQAAMNVFLLNQLLETVVSLCPCVHTGDWW